MKLGNHMPKKLREQARKGTPDKPAPICRWCGFAVVPEDAQIRHCPARDGDLCEPVRADDGQGGHLELTRLEGHAPERSSR